MEAYQLRELEEDYQAYEHQYALTLESRKPRTKATESGKLQHPAIPLNFTFLKLLTVNQLKKERPRAGKRKPIEIEEDEADQKNDAQNVAKEENEEGEMNPTGVAISRAQHQPQISNLLSNHYVSLQQTKNVLGGRKNDDGKVEVKRKKQIDYECDSLLLSNNELRSFAGLREVLRGVLPHGEPNRLVWINLSFNFLTKIDADILNFPSLKQLNMHGNFIADFEEVKKLQDIGTLQTLSLNGNPIEEVKGYRMYVLGVLYNKFETLKKLDGVIVSRQEFDNHIVWKERLKPQIFKNDLGKLRKLKVDNPTPPPALDKKQADKAKGHKKE